ncbi:hypothetical protein [Ferruginibacter profundus]
MKFFSKFVLLCNLCFIVTVVMHFVELHDKVKGKSDVAVPLQFVEGTMAVLGLISIMVNAVFCLIVLGLMAAKKIQQIPLWIVVFNFIALLAEIYWYFISK